MRIEDLIHDPSFRRWANGTSSGNASHWDAYLDKHPDQHHLLMTAREMVRAQPFAADQPDQVHKDQAWSRIHHGIRDHKTHRARRRLLKYAAVAAVAGIVSFGIFMFQESQEDTAWTTVRTGPGEIRTVALEDGSTVTLNGNSSLQYPVAFDAQERSVRLRGEAYFDVSHLGSSSTFEVLTGNARVEVLGTVFNVKSRHTRAVVSLIEGKVEVSRAHKGTVILRPGQSAEISAGGIDVNEDDVQARASWRNHLWVFDETPLSEVLVSLDESFGVHSEVDADINLEKTISGRLSTKNLSTLYVALETMLDVEITERDSGIMIQKEQ